jgi:hypothetical protein
MGGLSMSESENEICSVAISIGERLLSLLAKAVGLNHLPISEPELHRRLHNRMSATEKDELRANLAALGLLGRMA